MEAPRWVADPESLYVGMGNVQVQGQLELGAIGPGQADHLGVALDAFPAQFQDALPVEDQPVPAGRVHLGGVVVGMDFGHIGASAPGTQRGDFAAPRDPRFADRHPFVQGREVTQGRVDQPGIIRLVRDIRVIEQALGTGVKEVYESEQAAISRLRMSQSDESC